MTLTRRGLLAGAAALGASAMILAVATAAPAGFPDYRYQRLALVKSKLRYNPTGELIFPCIRGRKTASPTRSPRTTSTTRRTTPRAASAWPTRTP